MKRRYLAATPAVMALELVLLVLSPVTLTIAALASFADPRGRRPWRLGLLVTGYCVLELRATLHGLWLVARRAPDGAHYDLVGRFLERVRALAERTTAFQLQVESGSEPAAEFLRGCSAPVIVVARHAGAGDSFLIVQELLTSYGRRPRIVMKASLQLDPLIGLFGNRVPNCFISPDAEAAARAVRTLGTTLGDREALVIFPEGGNFSLSRRRRGIARLVRAGARDAARSAFGLENVAPPRPGGFSAALDAAPDAAIVVVAHTGLADAQSAGAFWRSIPFRRPARMRLWLVERSDVPTGDDERADWLFGWWHRVDDWIAAGGVE